MSDSNALPTRRAAGILLVTRQEPRQFLLMRHSDRWDLPKGHSEPDETDLETALRETEEETGLKQGEIAVDDGFRFEISYPVRYKKKGDRVFQKTVVYLLGEIDEVFTPVLTEHESFEWFDWKPPHQIQQQTIDPLLDAVARHWLTS